MARRRFWRGFAAGAAAGASGTLGALALANWIDNRGSRIVRVEKSLQIGRPIEEVFNSWASLNWLSQASDIIEDIEVQNNRSHWVMRLDGKAVEWDAEIHQLIPGQAIGWKSVKGPKHTGRITFAPIGNDTLLQVTMNYSPSLGPFRPLKNPMRASLENCVDRVLRDFKASLEGKGQEGRVPAIRNVLG